MSAAETLGNFVNGDRLDMEPRFAYTDDGNGNPIVATPNETTYYRPDGALHFDGNGHPLAGQSTGIEGGAQ